MKASRRVLTFVAGLMASCFALLAPLSAQQANPPVVAVSIAPLERALPELSYLLSAMNSPEISGVMEMMTGFYTKGIDRTRPIAILVSFDGVAPDFQVCVPMNDHKQWFQIMSGMGMEPEELGDGLYEISMAAQVMIAKVANGWMYLGQSEDSLATVPENPATLLGDLPQRYSFSVRVDLQQLPEDMRRSAIQEMRAGFEQTMAQQVGDQFESELEIARQSAEEQMEQLEAWIGETQRLVIGCLIDPAQKKVLIDGAIQFVEGSELAKQMDSQVKLKSDFTALRLPDASANVRVTSIMATSEEKDWAKESLRSSVEQIGGMLDKSEFPEEYADTLRMLVDTFASVAQQSIDQGMLDGAASFDFEEDVVRLLAGVRVASGKEVRQKLKDLVAGLPASADAQAEFDFASHNGFQLHQASFKLPKLENEAALAWGERIQLILADCEDTILVCIDQDAESTAKAAIDRLQTAQAVEVTPMEGSMRVGSLLRLMQLAGSNPMIDDLIPAFDLLSEDDTIQMTSTILPRGMVTRFAVDEGVLRAFGTVLRSGNFAPGF